MLIGYIRVSTNDQNTALQRNALECAGCELIFEDNASGKKPERPGLKKVLRMLSRDAPTRVNIRSFWWQQRYMVVMVENGGLQRIDFISPPLHQFATILKTSWVECGYWDTINLCCRPNQLA